MKAITVRQPWASLIAAGVKTIETRPRSTSYRGRIAIHAGKAKPEQGAIVGQHVVDWGLDPALSAAMSGTPHMGDGCGFILLDDECRSVPLPLGAVVASAVLTDCVPVENLINKPTAQDELIALLAEPGHAGHYIVDLDRERPLGDFSPGRWALLLDDIKPTTERCPQCWGDPVYHGLGCDLCRGAGTCDPVPARGQQAVPWAWTP